MNITSRSPNNIGIVTICINTDDPTLTTGKTVDVPKFVWMLRGVSLVAESIEVNGSGVGIGSPSRPYIIAKLNDLYEPTGITIEDASSEPSAIPSDELLIAKLIFADIDYPGYASDEIVDIEVYHEGVYNDNSLPVALHKGMGVYWDGFKYISDWLRVAIIEEEEP